MDRHLSLYIEFDFYFFFPLVVLTDSRNARDFHSCVNLVSIAMLAENGGLQDFTQKCLNLSELCLNFDIVWSYFVAVPNFWHTIFLLVWRAALAKMFFPWICTTLSRDGLTELLWKYLFCFLFFKWWCYLLFNFLFILLFAVMWLHDLQHCYNRDCSVHDLLFCPDCITKT